MRPWKDAKFIKYDNLQHWLSLRRTLGIGGSESAGILGLSPYTCAAKIFYEKLGLAPERSSNLAMVIGSESEDLIAKLWSHYDPNIGKDSIPRNYEMRKVIRKPVKLNRIVVNTGMPHLFSSTDRIFYDESGNRCVLELKTIGSWEEKKWEAGVPPHYLVQIQHYLMVLGASYAELAILSGGRDVNVYPFESSIATQQAIYEKGLQFNEWLTEARQILLNGGGENDIQHLVPGPDGSDAYTEFLREKDTADKVYISEELEATEEDFAHVRLLIEYEKRKKEADKQYQLAKQNLMQRMATVPKLNFGGGVGYITYKPDKNGNRSFNKAGIREEALLGS